jgi:DNA repair exonuclease SbcCD ATPase subunit
MKKRGKKQLLKNIALPIMNEIVLQDEEVNYPIQKIINLTFDKIYHIADIHVRPRKRHDEYREVFERLYNSINDDCNNSVIVICGDIIHEKNRLTSEKIMLLRVLLKKLVSICQGVIIIAGNHDLMESNLSRMDNLIPIVDDIKNVYYLKDTGVYDFGSAIFCVINSLLDKKMCRRRNIIEDIKDKKLIALYHGMLYESELYNKVIVNPEQHYHCKTIKDFEGFDLVLLGDIHRHQYLKKNIAYSGSLIQQDFGEDIQNHGIILWNLLDISSTFIPIDNNYGFIKIYICDGKLVNENINLIPNRPTIRYFLKRTTKNQLDVIHDRIRQIRDIQDYSTEPDDCEINTTITPVELTPLFDDIPLLLDLLKNNTDDDKKFIIEYHKRLKDTLKNNETNNDNNWFITSLTFRNAFIYGENKNYTLNFKDKHGVITIPGPNNIGKSNILKILLFGLFGDVAPGYGKSNVLNKYSEKYYIAVEFMCGMHHYRIERTGDKKPRNGSYTTIVDVNFTKIKDGVVIDNLNCEKTPETTAKIIKILGLNYYDFLLTNVYSIGFYESIVIMGNAERLNTLISYFKLGKYALLEQMVKNDITVLTTNNTIIDNQNTNIKNNYSQIDINILLQELEKLNDIKNKKEIENINIKNQLEKIDNDINILDKGIKKLCLVLDKQLKINNKKEADDKLEILYKKNPKKVNESLENLTNKFWMIESEIVKKINFDELTIKKENILNELKQHKPKKNIEKKQILKGIENIKSSIYGLKKIINGRFNKSKYINIEKNNLIKMQEENDNKIKEIIIYGEEIIIDENRMKYVDNIISKRLMEKDYIINNISQKINEELYNKIIMYLKTEDKFYQLFSEKIEFSKNLNNNKKIIEYKELLQENEEIKLAILQQDLNKYERLSKEFKCMEIHITLTEELLQVDKLLDIHKQNEEKRKELNNINEMIENVKVNKEIIELKEQLKILEKNDKILEKLHIIEEKIINKKQFRENIVECRINIVKEYEEIKTKIENLEQKINDWKNKQDELKKNDKQLNDIQTKLRLYKSYQECVEKSGIPLHLMQNKIKNIEEHINNNFLKPFTKYLVNIIIEDNSLYIIVKKDGINYNALELGGYEKFMLDIAFKSALSKYNCIGKGSIMCVDEGLDVFDKDNFLKLEKILQFLRTQYKVILLITHKPDIQDFNDHIIQIENDGKYSRLTFD